MRLSADRYEGERRQYTLALSMVEHGARLRTITRWTGLSKFQIYNLSQSYASATRTRCKRGVSPYQPAYFSKSLKIARESAAFAYIALQMQVIPDDVVPDAARSLPSVTRGECLMSAFEVYRALLPDCRSCPEVMVLDRLGPRHGLCPSCRTKHRVRRTSRDLLRQQ